MTALAPAVTDGEATEVTDEADPALAALHAIDRAVRSLYEALPRLAHRPEIVIDMLGEVAREQATSALRFADLSERVKRLRARHTLKHQAEEAEERADA